MKLKSFIVAVIPWLMVFIGFVLAYLFLDNVSKTSRENNVYTRFTACVLSIKPSSRGDEQINQCWETVTKDSNYYPKKYDTKGY